MSNMVLTTIKFYFVEGVVEKPWDEVKSLADEFFNKIKNANLTKPEKIASNPPRYGYVPIEIFKPTESSVDIGNGDVRKVVSVGIDWFEINVSKNQGWLVKLSNVANEGNADSAVEHIAKKYRCLVDFMTQSEFCLMRIKRFVLGPSGECWHHNEQHWIAVGENTCDHLEPSDEEIESKPSIEDIMKEHLAKYFINRDLGQV